MIKASDEATLGMTDWAEMDARKTLVEIWGEMASSWGVSRTMAQVYALLFVSPDPLDTDDVMRALSVSRGNANINLHKLEDWGLIRKVEGLDARRNYYSAEKDVWRATLRIIEERKKREIAPVAGLLRMLAEGLATAPQSGSEELGRNLKEMAEFLQLFEELTEALLPLLRNRDKAAIARVIEQLKSQG